MVGKAFPFLIINLLASSIFYYLCYWGLWIFSGVVEEEGQWFVRRIDIVGKSYSRLTTHAADQIAFFVAGFAACLFTFSNFSENNKRHFVLKAALIALIPLGFLLLTKVSATMYYYIPMGFIYGQCIAIVIVCLIKLFKGDKPYKHAQSKP